MNKYIYFTCFLLMINYCSNAQNKTCKSCECFSNISAVWEVYIDDKGTEYIKKGDSIKFIRNNIKQLVSAFNKTHSTQIKLLRLKDHIIYAKIINATFLTQQMGSAGADWYMASLIFTLTEFPGYDKVYLDYEEGDHGGQPGIRSRKEFAANYIICK